MTDLLLVLNGFILACVMFTVLYGVKLYRRFFITLQRRMDGLEAAKRALAYHREQFDIKSHAMDELKVKMKELERREAARKLR